MNVYILFCFYLFNQTFMHELSYIDIIPKDIIQKLLTIYNIYLQYKRSSFIKMQVSIPSDFKPALEVNHLATKTPQ